MKKKYKTKLKPVVSKLKAKIESLGDVAVCIVDYTEVFVEGGQSTIRSMVQFPSFGKLNTQFTLMTEMLGVDEIPDQGYICVMKDDIYPDRNQGLVCITTNPIMDKGWIKIPETQNVVPINTTFHAYYFEGSSERQPLIANVRDFYNQQLEINGQLNETLNETTVLVDLVLRDEVNYLPSTDLVKGCYSIAPTLGRRSCIYMRESQGQLVEITKDYNNNRKAIIKRLEQINASNRGG